MGIDMELLLVVENERNLSQNDENVLIVWST